MWSSHIGYIVAYDSCRARGEAAARAERAKTYLLSAREIDKRRVTIIDGGQRDEMYIELSA
jgi:hypothetical protein